MVFGSGSQALLGTASPRSSASPACQTTWVPNCGLAPLRRLGCAISGLMIRFVFVHDIFPWRQEHVLAIDRHL